MTISGGDIIEWYVLRTLSGKEEIILSILQKLGMFFEFEVFCPKRKIGWRKNGLVVSITRPLFEGYLFVVNRKINIWEFDNLLRRCRLNIAWLVRSAGSLVPIAKEEKHLLLRLMNRTKVVEVSKVAINKNEFTILEGPLVGLEHMIKKFCKKTGGLQ